MSAYSVNNDYISLDCLLMASNFNSYSNLRAIHNVDSAEAQEITALTSFGVKVKRFFMGK